MSLANAILQGKIEQVKQLLANGADPNEIDEYGFTPLIEAAVAQRTDMLEILLDNGAKVNGEDFAGRTALHWAVENADLPALKLLLDRGANANCYTNAAEPALTIALLRNNSEVKELLYKHDAKLDFARDYINAKLLAHRYELTGHTYIATPENKFIVLNLEGFFLEFSLSIMLDSLKRFKSNYAAREWSDFFPVLDNVIRAIEVSAELVRYQQYTVDLSAHQNRINQLFASPLLMVPATYEGHAITFVRFGNLFAKCDRGENSKFEGSVVIYEMKHPEALDKGLLQQIVYKKQDNDFMHSGINEHLGLKRLINVPIGPQITGNCSWANVEAAIPTMLLLLLAQKSQYRDNYTRAMKDALQLFEAWSNWDKDRALDECIGSFAHDNKTRNAAKAILLAAVLFQTCEYTDDKNIARAEKILSVLTKPEFEPYLRNYIEVYHNKRWTEAGENLMHLFDMVAPWHS